MISFRFKVSAAVACFAGCMWAGDSATSTWNEKGAASYLDGRMEWWTTWKTSARDHETFCVSCHTALPYALGRSALRSALGEKGASPTERKLLDNVTKRVRMWQEVEPFYPDAKSGAGKTIESRGTESILNALILVSSDAPSGKLSSDAELALQNMRAMQIKEGETAGAWPWLQFHNAPWEGDSQFLGSTLAALAIGRAPAKYRSDPALQEGLKQLRGFLARERKSQKLIDQMMLLWASTKLPEFLTPAEQRSIIAEASSKQQADGGFSLSSFVSDWKRKDNTPLEAKSDGYATGVVTFVLQEAGVKRSDAVLSKGISWLTLHQESEGQWLAYSLNKQRDLTSDAGRFMSDAATAYSVLALEHK